MIELSNHRLLILEVLLILINQGIPLIYDTPDVVKHLGVCVALQVSQCVVEGLVFSLLPLQLEVHVLDLLEIALQLTQNHLFIGAFDKLVLDLVEIGYNFWELLRIGLLVPCLFEELACLLLELVDLVVEGGEHGLQVTLGQLVAVDHVVVPVFANGASEADTN